jgi:2,4-dienoyl-CoA reductase-like NADH-dependent reductase (Old Yellow Enzyme family)
MSVNEAAQTAQDRYPHVFRPFKIGNVELANRIFIPAHTTNFARDFMPTSRHVAYQRERAKGGVALIFVEPMRIHQTSLGRAGGIFGGDPRAVPGLTKIVDAIHEGGARAFVQIVHTGRHSDNFVERLPPWAPSSVPWTTSGEIPHAVTHREMRIIRDSYTTTVELAIQAGFDGMEIHFGHGHLLHQFLSLNTNRRSDEYGGSFENRLRYPMEVLSAVLERVAGRVPVGVRMSVDDLLQGGLDVEDSREVARRVAAVEGVAFINASVAAYSWPSIGYHVADMSSPPHPFMNETVGLRDVIGDLPLLTANRYTSIAEAEEALATGAIDMIGMNRAHMADPNLVRKTLEGKENTIRPCVSSNHCIGQIAFHRPITCAMNPRVGREEEWQEEVPPAESAKRILIVGGGPAGLEAARVAAQRQHHVTLWERSPKLGGALELAGTGKGRHDLHRMQRYLIDRLAETSATVETSREGTVDAIAAFGADAVIIATGSIKPGAAFDGGAEALSVEEALGRERNAWAGAKICLVDQSGSWAALSVAETLADAGAAVTLVTAAENPLWDINVYSRMTAMDRLKAGRVSIWAGSAVQRYAKGRLTIEETARGEVSELPGFTHLVHATRGISDSGLAEELEDKGIAVHTIGDALAPRTLLDAIFDAHRLGRGL